MECYKSELNFVLFSPGLRSATLLVLFHHFPVKSHMYVVPALRNLQCIVDGLPGMSQLSAWSVEALRQLRDRAADELQFIAGRFRQETVVHPLIMDVDELRSNSYAKGFRVGKFRLPIGDAQPHFNTFHFDSPIPRKNAEKVKANPTRRKCWRRESKLDLWVGGGDWT